MSLRVVIRSEVKPIGVAVGKPSLNRAKLVACVRPEASRSIYGQVEAAVRRCGGPNRFGLKTIRMTCE